MENSRRTFLKQAGLGALALAAAPLLKACACEEIHLSEGEGRDLISILHSFDSETMPMRASRDGLVYVGAIQKNRAFGKPQLYAERLLHTYLIGTAKTDTVVLGVITGGVPLERVAETSGYSKLLVPEGSKPLVKVSYALEDPQIAFENLQRAKDSVLKDVESVRYHKILVSGLNGVKEAVSIWNPEMETVNGDSPEHAFKRTIGAIHADDYRFIIGGDMQDHQGEKCRVNLDKERPFTGCSHKRINDVIEEIKEKEGLDFAILAGDIIGKEQKFNQISEWQTRFLQPYGSLLHVPIYAGIGNHDMARNNRGGNLSSRHTSFTNVFGAPIHAFDKESETISAAVEQGILLGDNDSKPANYSFDVGDVHYVVLDSNTSGRYNRKLTESKQFLYDDMKENAGKINIMVSHHPFRIDPAEILEGMDSKIDAVFTGHNHGYERFERDGVHYVVTAGMGAWMRKKEKKIENSDERTSIIKHKTPHVTYGHYSNGRLSFEVRDMDNQVIDMFEIRK